MYPFSVKSNCLERFSAKKFVYFMQIFITGSCNMGNCSSRGCMNAGIFIFYTSYIEAASFIIKPPTAPYIIFSSHHLKPAGGGVQPLP